MITHRDLEELQGMSMSKEGIYFAVIIVSMFFIGIYHENEHNGSNEIIHNNKNISLLSDPIIFPTP